MNSLVTVTNKDLIKDLSADNFITLLYPLKSFCVGFDEYFDIDIIDDFVLINRLLEDKDLIELDKILKKGKFKGIVFDDLGILDIIKDLNVTKILLLDHLATNSTSINYYLEYVDSLVISDDLALDEINYILSNASKPLVLPIFGLKRLMYSRRNLLTNYALYHKLEPNKNQISSIEDKTFIIKENEYGTVFYASKYYNALKLLGAPNVLYYFYNPIGLDNKSIIKLLKENTFEGVSSELFLKEKTIYKVKEEA